MSAPNGGPPGYPPQQPYLPRPPSGGAGATIAAAVLAAVFVVATVVLALVAHHPGDSDTASSAVSNAPVGSVPSLDAGGPQVNGGSASLSTPTLDVPSVAPLPSVSTPPPLAGDAVNRVFQVYMNALLYHDLSALKSATCPKLRHTETGTALHHHYINRWQGKPYTIYPDQDYVRIDAVVTQADNGVKQTYEWQVVRYRSTGRYYVCGFFG